MSISHYSFCEHPMARILDQWHIRAVPSDEKSVQCGHAIETMSLCGERVVWDVKVTVNKYNAGEDFVCPACRTKYRELTKES